MASAATKPAVSKTISERMKTHICNMVLIGTSNIVVPGTKQTFPEVFKHQSRLYYYCSLFNSLGVNSSFYKVLMPSTFEKWFADVAGDFQFTLKLCQGVTHVKELKVNLSNIDLFMAAANRTKMKMRGCLLIQFPGKITLAYYNKVEKILQKLKENDAVSIW